MRRLRILSLVAIGHIGFSLFPSAALAQTLATDTTTFTGTVPGSCTISNGTQNVNMSYANNTLSAETTNITINSNVLANLTIGTVTEVAKANGSSPTATASLIDTAGNQQTVTATVGNDSNPMQFINNGMTGADHTIKIGMSVADANIPGTYTYTVVLSCLQR